MSSRKKDWITVDASGQVLGRLASRIALLLQGKHKPSYVPYEDRGDYVVVTNASRIQVTGKKKKEKIYIHHSQYPGGLKKITLEKLAAQDPTLPLYRAVKNMMPKNKIGAKMLRKLKIYSQELHPHGNHKPTLREITKP